MIAKNWKQTVFSEEFLVAICCPLKLFVYQYYSLFSFLSVMKPFTLIPETPQLIAFHSEFNFL